MVLLGGGEGSPRWQRPSVSRKWKLRGLWPALHTRVADAKNRETAPRYITHRENWPSLHTERTVEDVFLHQFLMDIFPACLANQLILKFRANQVEICDLGRPHKIYFLVGYGETLSHFYKWPVPLQTVPSKVVYIYDNCLWGGGGGGEDKCSLQRTETCGKGLK
ncbi:hypothetical protein FD754_013950 [Muntiacus muntjak]|uniref:Uncharacterized protein n=1 Tax=Muntiacus muntjak TaxID=9888 RepID=A0A5N3VJ84_MUNMU|nr:hypothetical protein FD754_013950 [Muntiacus muntjak]